MALGNQYLAPENGWVRFDDKYSDFEYSSLWSDSSVAGSNEGSYKICSAIGETIRFNFTGTSIRIISGTNNNLSNAISIRIDGKDYSYSINNSTLIWARSVFELTDLSDNEHVVVITTTQSTYSVFDALDLKEGNKVLKYKEPQKRIVIQSNDKYYSLSDNTLIHLPDSSDKNMILHGIEQGKEIQLDVPFTKHRYFNGSPVVNVCGKVFTHDIGVINTLNIKELVENKSFEPIFTWYNTNMTSNTSPSPLVASASSVYNTTYQAWRAFDGIKDVNAWLTVANTTTGWIKLDFGRKVIINVLKMTCRGGTTDAITKAMPKDFEIYGSNDDSTYTLLGTINNQTNWSFLEERLFVINNSAEYRYIKLNILNNNGFTEYSNIGELIYGYKREVN